VRSDGFRADTPAPLISALRSALALPGELLLVCGAVVGLFAAWLSWGQSPLPTAEQQQAVHAIQHAFRTGAAVPPGVVALIRIPALGADGAGRGLAVPGLRGHRYSGVEPRPGPLHPNRPPGRHGNVALAGQRSSDSGSEPLADLPDVVRVGDPIVVETAAAEYTYRITARHRSVPPTSPCSAQGG
jgi:hypothetical protein